MKTRRTSFINSTIRIILILLFVFAAMNIWSGTTLNYAEINRLITNTSLDSVMVSPDSLGADLLTGQKTIKFFTISNDTVGNDTLLFEISISPHDTSQTPVLGVSNKWAIDPLDMSNWSQSSVPAAIVDEVYGDNRDFLEATRKTNAITSIVPKVLLLASDSQIGSAETALISTGMFAATDIDLLNNPLSLTLDQLVPYNAVLVWSNSNFTEPLNIGNVLKEYVDIGSGVVIATYALSTNWALQGGIFDPNYSPFIPAPSQAVSGLLDLATLTNPSHPIFKGITVAPTYSWNSNYSNPTLNAGGILLAQDTSGNNVVAENPDGSVVGIGIWPGNLINISNNAETKLMFANALYHVSNRWLSTDPISGVLAPGDSTDISVTFDAFRLPGGSYDADIVVTTNDTTNPSLIVRAHLNVTSAPDIAVSTDTLQFGKVFVGYPELFELVVTNFGSDSLSVTNIVSDNAVFSVDKTAFGLNPNERDTVTVTFSPSPAGIFSGLITISSNDPDELNVIVLANGEGLLPPVMVISPDSIEQVLVVGDSADHIITIDNSAGGSELIWEGFTFQSGGANVLASSPKFAGRGEARKSKEEDTYNSLNTSRSFIYRSEGIADDAAEGKSRRNSVKAAEKAAAAVGERSLEFTLDHLNLNFGTVTAAILAKFNFSDGVVGTNILDGGNDMYDGGNFISTDLGGPIDYSDDLIIDNTAFGIGGRYFTRKYPGLFVLAADIDSISNFDINGNLGADGYGSADGAILQLNKEGITYSGFVKRVFAGDGDPSVNHLIIVVQNPDVGHEFSFDTNDDYHSVFNLQANTRLYYLLYAGSGGTYINNETTLRIMNAFLEAIDPLRWIRLTPKSGTVAAGASVTMEVFLDGRLLSPALYGADIRIISNDPSAGEKTIPVKFKVLPQPIDPPEILSIDDVPEDQGGWVTLSWTASRDDNFFSKTPVEFYSIWLRDNSANGVSFKHDEILLKSANNSMTRRSNEINTTQNPGLEKRISSAYGFERESKKASLKKFSSSLNKRSRVAGKENIGQIDENSDELNIFELPGILSKSISKGGRWIGIGTIGATQDTSYMFLVHTLVDSNDLGTNWSHLKISAHPENPFIHAFSEVDSGYSVDNLSPAVPSGLSASITLEESIQLTWYPPVDEDFEYFRIYRDTLSGFDSTVIEPYSESIDTLFIDSQVSIDQTYYYRLSAVDFNGNESYLSQEVSATIVGIEEGEIIPSDYVLYDAYPNPFNPSTTIGYGLPQQSDVTLIIYNLTGQEIMRWDENDIPAGYYQKAWNGTNKFGAPVVSGVYLYRFVSGDFVGTRKIVLLK